MEEAVRSGDLQSVIAFYNNGTITDVYTMLYAAAGGHLDIVIWLHENTNCTCPIQALEWSAEDGHFEVVKFLYDIRKIRKKESVLTAMKNAAKNKHYEIVGWLYSQQLLHNER